MWVHLPTAVYGLVIITVGFTCPLTPLERSLHRQAGERTFTGGFVDHYIEGVIHPQQYAGPVRGLVVVLVVAGYARLVARAGHTSVSFTLDRYGHLYPHPCATASTTCSPARHRSAASGGEES